MNKDKQKLSFKNNNFANSEPQLLRVQINSCEDLDSFNNDQVLINDHLNNNNFENLLKTKETKLNITDSKNSVDNFFKFNNFKIDEIKISEDLFIMKKIHFKKDENNFSQNKQVEILNFKEISNNDELVLPTTQLIQNENLEFNDTNNLNNNQTVPIIPKYEVIENDILDFSNLENDLPKKSNYFVSQSPEEKKHRDFDIDDNQWTLVPNFDSIPSPKNSVKKIREISKENNSKAQKVNSGYDKKELSKSLSKNAKNNNKKIVNPISSKKEDVISPDIIKVKSLKTNSKKIIKKKQIKNTIKIKSKKQTKEAKSKSRKNELLINSIDALDIQNLKKNPTYIKPNNEIISNDLVLNNKSQNNLFLSPLPVNAEKLQDYYENNFYLTKKIINDSNKNLQKMHSITSLTSLKYKFKGPEIVVQDSFADNFLKLKKIKKSKK